MSDKQALQAALEALAESKKEDEKATNEAIESIQKTRKEQAELSSRPD